MIVSDGFRAIGSGRAEFAKSLYGLIPVPRVRIPPSPPDSCNPNHLASQFTVWGAVVESWFSVPKRPGLWIFDLFGGCVHGCLRNDVFQLRHCIAYVICGGLDVVRRCSADVRAAKNTLNHHVRYTEAIQVAAEATPSRVPPAPLGDLIVADVLVIYWRVCWFCLLANAAAVECREDYAIFTNSVGKPLARTSVVNRFPDVPVTPSRRRPFVVRRPRQVHPFDEIANRNDSLGWDCAAIDGCHVPLSFSLDVGGWTFPVCRNFAEQMRDSLTLDRPHRCFDVPSNERTNGRRLRTIVPFCFRLDSPRFLVE